MWLVWYFLHMTPTRQGSLRLFRFAGIDLYLHWSWFLIAVYGISSRAGRYSSLLWPVLEYLALFLIVLLHEFGHVLSVGQHFHPPWTPTESSALVGDGPVPYGKPGYALGAKGLWIGLVGIDARTRGKSHYGIHSTSEPESIGKEQSLGCIRLADEDIELVYSLLYEVHSTVQIKP